MRFKASDTRYILPYEKRLRRGVWKVYFSDFDIGPPPLSWPDGGFKKLLTSVQ